MELVLVGGEDMSQWGGQGNQPGGGGSETTGGRRLVDYDAFTSTGDPDSPVWIEVDEKSMAGLCYTSGTTGRPKGVDYSHRSLYLLTMLLTMKDYYQMSGADCLLSIVPMFHAFSWIQPYTALMLGCRLVLPGPHAKV